MKGGTDEDGSASGIKKGGIAIGVGGVIALGLGAFGLLEEGKAATAIAGTPKVRPRHPHPPKAWIDWGNL